MNAITRFDLGSSFWIPFAALAMRLASTPTANLSYLLLAVYATLGRTQAIQALAFSWLFSMISPGIAPVATQGAVGRYAVIAGAALSVLLRSGMFSYRFRFGGPVAATLLLGVFFVVHSLAFSPMADVSILKAVSWSIVMATLISAWMGLSIEERDRLARQLFGGLIVLLIVSLPLLLHPIGYLRNGRGFQGALGHPQAFGPTIALLGAWSGSRILAKTKPAWFEVGLFGVCVASILLSEARTAGVAMVLSLAASLILISGLSGLPIRAVMPGLNSGRVWGGVLLALALGLGMAGRIADVTNRYLAKSGRAEVTGLLEAYERSRGELIREMWANIERNPMTGIGFGVASNPSEMEVTRDPIFNLPVSASIEKGVMPLAILEEVGAIGFALTTIWLWMLIRRGARGGLAPLAIIGTALLLNMGESMFFSPGGMGLLLMILVGWAFASARKSRNIDNGQTGRLVLAADC